MPDIVDEYYKGIVECLVTYGGVTEAEARIILENSGLLENVKEESVVFHEYPYYWAMHLLHAKSNPSWYKDPKLWPPPREYLSGKK